MNDPAALEKAMSEIENDSPPDAATAAANGRKATTKKKTTAKKTTAKKTTARKTPKDKTPAGRTPGRPGLDRRIEEQITGIGILVVAMGDEVCGGAILDGSERLAKSLKHLADENPRVKRTLESFLATSAWGEVVMATGAIALPILSHHNVNVIPKRLRKERPAETDPVEPIVEVAS